MDAEGKADKERIVSLLLGVFALLPLIGSIKYADEILEGLKEFNKVRKAVDLGNVKYTDEVMEVAEQAAEQAKHAEVLEETTEQAKHAEVLEETTEQAKHAENIENSNTFGKIDTENFTDLETNERMSLLTEQQVIYQRIS